MMLRSTPSRTLLLVATAAICCGMAFAQQDTKPAKKCKPKDTSCTSPAQDTPPATTPPQSLHDQFPFPTEDSRHGGDAEGTPAAPPANPSQNGLPPLPTGSDHDPPPESEKPMHIPRSDDSSSSSSSSGSGSSSSSSADDDSEVAPTTAAPNAPVKAAPLKNYGARDSSEAIHEKLEKTRIPDDLKVGKFYLQDGNTQGAYLRFKDAVTLDAEDPDARFYLAEAASKLNKKDEAIANYRECLKLDPGGDHDKASRKALSKLGSSPQ